MDDLFDVIVIGGGSAGLSAGLALGRARRRALVLDGGAPRNRVASHMHNVLGHDGLAPAELLVRGRAELERYGVEVRRSDVVAARVDEAAAAESGEPRFAVETGDGVLRARRLAVATGVEDVLPDVRGIAEQWGRGVVQCPYCDGWEVRDLPLAVLATSEASLHQAHLLRQWSADLTLLVDDAFEPDADAVEALSARGTRIERTAVAAILERGWSDERPAVAVELADGRVLELARIFTAPAPRLHDGILRDLGAERTMSFGVDVAAVDEMGRTSVAGVAAAGNVVAPFAGVAVAMAQGSMAGAWLNADLVQEDVRAAVRLASATS